MSQSKTINWNEVEAREASGAGVITQGDRELEIYRERRISMNLRKAEALSLAGATDFLQSLRTLIARGKVHEAQKALQENLDRFPEHRANPEWKLEQARLHSLNGRWQECTHEVNELLLSEPTLVTRMTALQVRALANYELGMWETVASDINVIRSLAELYSSAQAAFFNELLDIRVSAVRGDTKTAERALATQWKVHLEKSTLTIMHVLGLLRAEAHVARLSGLSARRSLLATHIASAFFGDDLYEAQARYELFINGDTSSILKSKISEDRARFSKIAYLMNDFECGNQSSTSSKVASIFKEEHCTIGYEDLNSTTKQILIPHRNLLIRLHPFGFEPLAKTTRPLGVLLEISTRKDGSKADIFEAVFKQKYSAALHNTILRQILSRIRKTWQIEVHSENGVLSTPGVLVVTR